MNLSDQSLIHYPVHKNNMIIIKTNKKINTINQNIYSFIINSLDFSALVCPKCKNSGLYVHAYYTRKFKHSSISITRVRCPHCGSTHSILIFPMVPFVSSVCADDVICILSNAFDHLEIENSHIFYFFRKFANTVNDVLDVCFFNSRKYYLNIYYHMTFI